MTGTVDTLPLEEARMIRRISRSLVAVVVSVLLSLACALPAVAQWNEGAESPWTSVGDWLAKLSRSIGTWARADEESVPYLDPNGLTDPQPPDAIFNGGDGGPDSTNDTAPFIDPDG